MQDIVNKVALLLLFAVECCDEESVVRQEAARHKRVVDAVNRLAAAIEPKDLIDGDIAYHFAIIARLTRDNLDRKLPVVVVGDSDHLRVVGLNDVAHLKELALNTDCPFILLSFQAKAADSELVFFILELLIPTNGNRRLRIVSYNDLDNRKSYTGVELEPIS